MALQRAQEGWRKDIDMSQHSIDDRLDRVESKTKVIEPKLAARIKQLRLPNWPKLTADQEQQRVYAVENLIFAVKTALAATAIVVVVWFTLWGLLDVLASTLRNHAYLRDLWPWNERYTLSLQHSRISEAEQNFFLMMNSIASAIWTVWLISLTIHCLRHKTTFYMRRWLPATLVIASFCLLVFVNFGLNDHPSKARRSHRPCLGNFFPVSVPDFPNLFHVWICCDAIDCLCEARPNRSTTTI